MSVDMPHESDARHDAARASLSFFSHQKPRRVDVLLRSADSASLPSFRVMRGVGHGFLRRWALLRGDDIFGAKEARGARSGFDGEYDDRPVMPHSNMRARRRMWAVPVFQDFL